MGANLGGIRGTPSEEASESAAPEDYGKLRADLARAVSRVCPAWLVDRRDDLVQAATMRVMEIHRKSEGNRELSSSYLYKVAYSALIDEIRRVKRRREIALEEVADSGTMKTMSGGESPEQAAAAVEIGRGIETCLQAMKRERRMAVVLNLQGHSVPDAARILEWSFKRTENLVYRGMADLRECLAAKGFSP